MKILSNKQYETLLQEHEEMLKEIRRIEPAWRRAEAENSRLIKDNAILRKTNESLENQLCEADRRLARFKRNRGAGGKFTQKAE